MSLSMCRYHPLTGTSKSVVANSTPRRSVISKILFAAGNLDARHATDGEQQRSGPVLCQCNPILTAATA